MSGRDVLIYLSLKYKGDWNKIMTIIRNKEEIPNEEEVNLELGKIKSKVVTLLDHDFPEVLKAIAKPPLVLYYYGNLDLIKDMRNCVSIVGSREPSKETFEMVKEVSSGLAKKGFTVVSGLAKGIDSAAAMGALPSKKAVAFLGCGIDYIYPPENAALFRKMKEDGLLISEYPSNSSPNQNYFPNRNRLLAGASKATIIAEAGSRSGTMITAGLALECGREVGVFPRRPGDINSFGNRLIHEGAVLIEGLEDVLELLGEFKTVGESEK